MRWVGQSPLTGWGRGQCFYEEVKLSGLGAGRGGTGVSDQRHCWGTSEGSRSLTCGSPSEMTAGAGGAWERPVLLMQVPEQFGRR